MTTFSERFADYLSEIGDGTLVALYNEYAAFHYYEHIYSMGDFNELMQGYEPMNIACQVHFGKFEPWCDWFTFDGYGNIESISNPSEYIDLNSLESWCEEHERDVLMIDGDAEILYECDEEDEEDEEDEDC